MPSFRNVIVTVALQAAAVFLTQFASTAKKFFDIFLSQSTFLNIAALFTTVAYSVVLYFAYVWLTNRWSPRFASVLLLSLMSLALLVLGVFVLPHWKYTPHDLVVFAHKCSSFHDYLRTFIYAAPFIKTQAFLSVYGIFCLTFAFWQTINSTVKPKQAQTWYPLLTLSFGGLNYAAIWCIRTLLSSTVSPYDILLPASYCIVALAPLLIIFTASLYALPQTDTLRLSASPLAVLRQCVTDTRLRSFTLTNIAGVIVVGLLTTYVLDINILAHHRIIMTPGHWPSYNASFVWGMLFACAIVAYVVMNLFSPVALLKVFALFLMGVGAAMAIFLPTPQVPITLMVLYGVMAIKGCKHALFTTPKQVIYCSWTAEHQVKAKAFFDICVDRFSFLIGALIYTFIKALQLEYGGPFYPILGCCAATLGAFMFWNARALKKLKGV